MVEKPRLRRRPPRAANAANNAVTDRAASSTASAREIDPSIHPNNAARPAATITRMRTTTVTPMTTVTTTDATLLQLMWLASPALPVGAFSYSEGLETAVEAATRAKAQEHVWNAVWERRIVYFLTVGASAWLALYPLLRKLPAKDEYLSPIRWVSDIIRVVGGFLPGFAQPWIDGYARSPVQFLVLLAIVIGLIGWSVRIAARISDAMGAIWRRAPSAPTALPTDWIYRLRSHRLYVAFHDWLKKRAAPAFFALLFVYLGVTLASHLAYNVQDVAGFTCREDPMAQGLARGETLSATFATSGLCNNTGIFVEGGGARYLVKVETTRPFRDGGIPSPLGGFHATDAPDWHQQLALVLGVPLRRELTRPWFRLVLRYGAVGGEEVFLDPDPEDGTIEAVIRPTRSGELLIFVNDAVIGIPRLYDVFYRNNAGEGRLTVTRR